MKQNYSITSNWTEGVFDEILKIHQSSIPTQKKYIRFYNILDRICKQFTINYPTEFSTLFSRLHALCKKTNYKYSHSIDSFRINAKQIIQNETNPTNEDYLYDLKALCDAISHFINHPIPSSIQNLLPLQWKKKGCHTLPKRLKYMRIVVEEWDEIYIYGFDAQHDSDKTLKINYTVNKSFAQTNTLLYPHVQLNLLNICIDEKGIFYPEIFVLEPDYLIDISSLAACYQNYGSHPLNYLVQKFQPQIYTHQILLGNAANQFLDDFVNEQPDTKATYEQTIQTVFHNDPIAYTACEEIDKFFFDKAHILFNHIQQTLRNLSESSYDVTNNGVLLEPSFLCEHLGLQGRMDYLQKDYNLLIELKSGKAEEWRSIHPKESHAIQIALYKEVLYHNLNINPNTIKAYLFYAQYPKLFTEHCTRKQIQEAINLRNQILANERIIRLNGSKELIESITPEVLNTKKCYNNLWSNYQKPQLIQFLQSFYQADELTRSYFHAFNSFIGKEQFLAKIGNASIDSYRSFANTWNTILPTKQTNGDILTNLKIHQFVYNEGIEKITLEIPQYEQHIQPNFRVGDIILLYESNIPQDSVINKQVIRGNIEKLSTRQITIRLKNKQKNPQAFNQESFYAIEHDFMDSSFNNLYKGLYSLLTTPPHRRNLLLCQREPQFDTRTILQKHYINEQIDDIVLHAKQAKDYFLLIGPPGTGKTSVALRSMVEEFYADPSNNLLLLSYTNRAVDEICRMLTSIDPTPDYIRIGSEATCEEQFRSHLIKHKLKECRNRNEVKKQINDTRIFVGTTSAISGTKELFKLKHFQIAIIDEASQILEPQIIGIFCAHNNDICAIDKFILIGDHKQLPAVVLQRQEESVITDKLLQEIGLIDCRNSLFERLLIHLQQHPQTRAIKMLNKQGRMHPDISKFINKQFYAGLLDVIPLPHQRRSLEWQLHGNTITEQFIAQTRIGFINTPYPPLEDSNKTNRHEAFVTAQLVNAIYKLCTLNGTTHKPSEHIGIIVPFRNQIACITDELKQFQIPNYEQITIDTVERYQGSQRDIIIYGTTISQPYQLDIISTPSTIGGIIVDRKLNVALTRARKQLFVIGNWQLLQNNSIYKALINSIKKHGAFIAMKDLS